MKTIIKTYLIFLLFCTVICITPYTMSAQTGKKSKNLPERLNENKVTLMAVGDIMMHTSLIRSGFNSKSNRYDYSACFEEVKPVFETADWVIGNLETRLAGEHTEVKVAGNQIKGYTGYPLFNAPERLAFDLKKAGFTFLTTANNHSYDRHVVGIINTNKVLDRAGILHTGTFISQADRDSIRILEKNGIRMAVFAYTYGLNGLKLPRGKDFLANLIDLRKIKDDLNRAKQMKVDLITCALHFGAENRRRPDSSQIALADTIIKLGADIILGSHPHVVQPFEIKTVSTENGSKRDAFVIYSLGNFLSSQRGVKKEVGVILKMTINKKISSGNIKITGIETIPTYIHRAWKRNKWSFKILPFEKIFRNQINYTVPDSVYDYIKNNFQ